MQSFSVGTGKNLGDNTENRTTYEFGQAVKLAMAIKKRFQFMCRMHNCRSIIGTYMPSLSYRFLRSPLLSSLSCKSNMTKEHNNVGVDATSNNKPFSYLLFPISEPIPCVYLQRTSPRVLISLWTLYKNSYFHFLFRRIKTKPSAMTFPHEARRRGPKQT